MPRRVAVALLALLGLAEGCAPAATPAGPPPPRATATRSAAATGAPSPFHLIFADQFDTPSGLGSFSGCDHAPDTPAAYCSGLTGRTREDYWAYPAGWPDTATQRHRRVGGYYDPATTLWVSRSPSGDGQLHIRLWRGASGPVHAAALVPRAAIGLRYGKVEERFRVSHPAPGYKSAHMFWPLDDSACSECEEDFPEGNWAGAIYAYAHHERGRGGEQDAFDTAVAFTGWHTADIEWTPDGVTFRLDGYVVGRSTDGVPRAPMMWILQNETALNGPAPAPDSWAQMDVTSLKVWSYR